MRRIALLMLAAFLLPLAYAIHSPCREGIVVSCPLPSPDTYAVIAQSFAEKGELRDAEHQLTAHREPAYPVLLGVFLRLFGEKYMVAVGLNAALNALLVLSLWWAATFLFGPFVGWLSALIAAFYPGFIYYAAQPRRETLMSLLAVLMIGLLVKAWRRQKTSAFAGAGAVAGLAGLTNVIFLPFGLIGAPLGLLWLERRNFSRAARWVLVYLACLVAVYSPWVIRNRITLGRWIIGTTGVAGGDFYVNQIVPAEIGGLPQETELLENDPIYQEGHRLPEAQSEKFFWHAGLERLKGHPGHFLGLVAKRFFFEEWRLYPRPRAYDASYRLIKWASLASDGWIIPLALLGILLFWKFKPPEAGWIVLLILSLNAVYSVMLFTLRYRIPNMPWLIVFAALTIEQGFKSVMPINHGRP